MQLISMCLHCRPKLCPYQCLIKIGVFVVVTLEACYGKNVKTSRYKVPRTSLTVPVHVLLPWELWLYGLHGWLGWSFIFVEFWLKNSLSKRLAELRTPQQQWKDRSWNRSVSTVLPQNWTHFRWIWRKRKKHWNWCHSWVHEKNSVTFTSKITALVEMYCRLLTSVTDIGKHMVFRYDRFSFFYVADSADSLNMSVLQSPLLFHLLYVWYKIQSKLGAKNKARINN